MKYYKIIDEPNGIPIPWKDLPENIKKELPGDFLWNVKTVNENGIIGEKTIVYLEETDEGPEDDWNLYDQIDEDITIILAYDDIC